MAAKDIAAIRHRRTLPQRLKDTAEYGERFMGYKVSVTQTDFAPEHGTVAAIERCVSIVGDLIDTLDADERRPCSEAALAPFIGLGDYLIRGYGAVDLKKIWPIAHNDARPLKSTMEHAIHTYFSEASSA